MSINRPQTVGAKSELRQALAASRGAFWAIALFSAVVNVLALTGSIFMLEIYDRVLPSRSVPTLIALLVLTVALFSFQGLLDGLRGRLLARAAAAFDERLSGRIFRLLVRLPLQPAPGAQFTQPARDLDVIRSYLAGRGPTAFFDLPWLPFYLAICFAFHVWIGVTVLVGALVLIALTIMTEICSGAPVREATQSGAQRTRLAETARRNAEALTALGMIERLFARWKSTNDDYLHAQIKANDVVDGLGSAGRVFRLMLQSIVLAVGAYLVINQEASAGVIIASSILSARALAPVDLAISHWRSLVAARQARQRLELLLKAVPESAPVMKLPAPSRGLSVEHLGVTPPQSRWLVVQDVNFAVEAGAGIGIIGPSASGKSSLGRAMVGVWPSARGSVRLDGAKLDQWSGQDLGRHIGYLPQDVELLEGTVGDNIARFDPDADPDAVIAAARAAGVHEMIVRLSNGYDTPVGEQGSHLSAGQQQRVALARALYGDPFLVVLDEPNSNLDAEGDRALTEAILGVRRRGGVVLVIAHRTSALAGVDQVLALAQGQQQAFGPKDEVLKRVLRPESVVAMATRPVAVGEA